LMTQPPTQYDRSPRKRAPVFLGFFASGGNRHFSHYEVDSDDSLFFVATPSSESFS